MKIGIDVSMLVYVGSGVATYTFQLVSELVRTHTKHTYHLFYSSLRRPSNFYYLNALGNLGAQIHDYPFPPRVLSYFWNTKHVFPARFFIGSVDLFHSSDFLRPPLSPSTIGVTTIHDLTWKLYPQFHTHDIIQKHERKLKKTIEANDHIIVDSLHTKSDLITCYPNMNNAISIVPLGVEKRFTQIKSEKEISNVLRLYQIRKPYILYLGAIEPRKNLPTLIHAFCEIKKKYNNLSLVIAGRAGWKNKEVFELVKKLQLSNDVHFPGFIQDKDLPSLYQGATVFVYPSLYEGYGLPPLESLAGKTPIIAYNAPSISDTFVESISQSRLESDIVKQIEHPFLHDVPIRTWEDVARDTLAVYDSLL